MNPRIHISLDVADLAASIAFYEILLGVPPSKVRDGYAKFEPASPSLNLALNHRSGAGGESRVSHFGIQVDSRGAVREANARLSDAGLLAASETDVTCCYAVQDKAWATDPDGNAWEVFVVTQADTPVHSESRTGPGFGCCPTAESRGCC